jgi:hypothetical protein
VIGHLGSRVSDLLDGRLSAEEEERAWDHVHLCHQCRDQVEREGWVKTRLAGLSLSSCGGASPALKGSLLDASLLLPPGESYLVAGRSRARSSVLAVAGGGALGAAVLGLVTLVGGPAAAPTVDLRPPTVSNGGSTPAPTLVGFTVDPHRRDQAHLLRQGDTMSK